MKGRLNKRAVDAARYQGTGACYVWDTETAGFGLRIYPSGRKSFVVTYRVRGKQRFHTIGRFGEMTVDQARTEALETLALARKGEDRSGERQASRRAPTIADLAARFMKEHSEVRNKPRTIQRNRETWDRVILPRLGGGRKVADIDRAEVAKLHTDLAATPSAANTVRAILSKAFNLAELWGWRPENSNPCRHVERYKEEARERYLSEAELSRLGGVLAEAGWVPPHAVAAIRLLVFTGCRSAEILTLQWKHVDFERRSLNLPDSKTDKKVVRLNAAALEVLAGVERVPDNPHVIPGARRGSHRRSLQHIWDRICEEAELEDVRIHDLRHTFASIGVNAGINLQPIGKLLGHTKTATTERYAHLADDPVRQANETIGSTLEATLSGKPKASVVPLRSAVASRT